MRALTTLRSLPHGAGRRWTRSKALAMPLDPKQDGKMTSLGGTILCSDPRLLAEERPRAYKDIDAVVGDTVVAGLAQVAAVMRPVITFKC